MDRSGYLTTKKAICDYIGVGKSSFDKLLDQGLPAVKVGKSWESHKDLIDKFLLEKIEKGLRK